MDSSDIFRGNAEKPLIVESSDITNHNGNSAMFADVATLANKLLAKFRLSILIGTALIASGLFHLALLWVTGAVWSGPLSLRKPGLFGVSAGVTAWSIAWVLTQGQRAHWVAMARWAASAMLIYFVIESSVSSG